MQTVSLQAKIVGLVIILLFSMCISSSVGIVKMKAIGNKLQDIAEEDMPLTKMVTDITEHQQEQAIWFERILRFANITTSSEKTKKAIEQAEHGKNIVANTSDTFKQVNESSSSVGTLISEITVASNEQSLGIEQITIAISQMDIVTQRNASTSEESASASEELKAQAETMTDMLLDLQFLVDGGKKKTSQEINSINYSPDSEMLTA